MDELTERIKAARKLDDVLPLLEDLSREVARVLATRDLGESDVARLVRPVETMRMMLERLSEALGHGNTPQALAVRDLAARCLDLEGRLKETRNDRLRPKFAA